MQKTIPFRVWRAVDISTHTVTLDLPSVLLLQPRPRLNFLHSDCCNLVAGVIASELKRRACRRQIRSGNHGARVSRMWCFAFSTISSGSFWPQASLIYVLSRAITGLTSGAARTPFGNAAAAMVQA